MMTIFGRYLFRQAAGALILILSSLTGVVWIALALKQLNLITSEGQDSFTFLKMTTLALPNLMVLIAPIALLIASIHTLNRLNGDSELIVLTAAGATMWNVARPLLLLGMIVTMAVSAVNHVVMPWSLRRLQELVVQVRSDLISQVIQPGKFITPEHNLTFHIRERSQSGELFGILLTDSRDPKQSNSYLAERGNIIKQDKRSFLLMRTGHIVRQTDPRLPPQLIEFDTYAVDLDRFEKATGKPELRPRERYLDELLNPEADDAAYKRQPGHFRAELHERFSNPIYPLAFVMIALAFVGNAQSTRSNRTQSVVMAFALAIGFRLVGLATNNLVVLRESAVLLLYGLPLGAIVLSLVVMRVKARPKGGRSLMLRMTLEFERLTGRSTPDAVGPQVAAASQGAPKTAAALDVGGDAGVPAGGLLPTKVH
jgi:lipopolysaccharide export system permease protein